jgi:hypothetical protein
MFPRGKNLNSKRTKYFFCKHCYPHIKKFPMVFASVKACAKDYINCTSGHFTCCSIQGRITSGCLSDSPHTIFIHKLLALPSLGPE